MSSVNNSCPSLPNNSHKSGKVGSLECSVLADMFQRTHIRAQWPFLTNLTRVFATEENSGDGQSGMART
jgi:hypothetical protein